MALHSDGEKHGWGSASLPQTHYGDATETIAIAEKIAAELEQLGIIDPGWSVPAERASYTIGGGAGIIREPDGSWTNYDASGRALIVPAGGARDSVFVRVGDERVWIDFYADPQRHSMQVPLAAVT
jgi:hypothetical protein